MFDAPLYHGSCIVPVSIVMLFVSMMTLYLYVSALPVCVTVTLYLCNMCRVTLVSYPKKVEERVYVHGN